MRTAVLVIVALNAIVGEICGNVVVKTVENVTRIAKVSENCRSALELYTENLKNSTNDMWALKMWDATSKVPVGLISYNFGEMGNFKQCIETKSTIDNVVGKYCLGSVTMSNVSSRYIASKNETVRLQQQDDHRNLVEIKSLVSLPSDGVNVASVYVGQSGRNLSKRYAEHVRSFRLGKSDLTFSNHPLECNHKFPNLADTVSAYETKLSIYWRDLMSIIATGISMVGNPTWAVCIPSNCTNQDVLNILNDMHAELIEFETVSCQTIDDVNPQLTKDAIIGISILTVIIVTMATSTAYDLYCCSQKKDPAHLALIAFSVYTNGGKLFHVDRKAGELSSLNGMRFMSMVWIVAVHTHSVYTSGPVFNSKGVIDFTNSPLSMIFISGNLACDTFLMISGVLVTYVFFKQKRFEKDFNVFRYYIHRYIRLTPALAGTVLVSATLLRYMGSGPKWNFIVNGFENNCKDYWWSTLLYVQNYVNVDRMCVGQSWYLNVDMQLYLFSPAILFSLIKYPISSVAVLVSASLASIAASFWTAYHEQLSGITSNFYPKVPAQTYMDDYYLKTQNRASPWLMGLILGYFLTREYSKSLKIPKIVSALSWIFCFVVMITCVFGGHGTLRSPDYDRLGNSFYIALVRPAWALFVGWMIWACATNHAGVINNILSYPIFQFLNKFTYSIYLLHVTSLYMIVFSQKTSIYFTVFNLAYYFWGIFMFSFGLSIIWVLAFESPALVLEKIIFPPILRSKVETLSLAQD